MKNNLKNILILVAILIAGVVIYKFFPPHKTSLLSQTQTYPVKKRRIRITSPRPTPPTQTPAPAPIKPITPTAPPAPKPAPKTTPSDELVIANHDVMVQIADTEATRAQGLSGRKNLAVNDGMLFIFQTPDIYDFWMKDMNFPLDFIWIYQSKVIQVTPNVPVQPGVPDDQLHNYSPPSLVDSVLEVNAGWAANNDIQVGDSVVDQF